MPTYRVWVENSRGSDYAYSIRSRKQAVKKALALAKKNKLNDVTVATGRSLMQERALNKKEKAAFRAEAKRQSTRPSKARRKVSRSVRVKIPKVR